MQGNTFYFHTPCPEGHACRRATIAVERQGDNIVYGISICEPRDNFNREAGRELAKQRLNEGFGSVKVKPHYFDQYTTLENALGEFSVNMYLSMLKSWSRYTKKVHEWKDKSTYSQTTVAAPKKTHVIPFPIFVGLNRRA